MTDTYTLTFEMLVTIMKKKHAVVLCGKTGSVGFLLQEDECPESLDDALRKIEEYWEEV